MNKKNFKNVFYKKKEKDNTKKILGFWIYLMSDCIFFTVLFFVYLNSLTNNYNKNFFNILYIFIETIILLLSSVSYGLSYKNIYINKKKLIYCLVTTLLLGTIFLLMEFFEFYHLISLNIKPQTNAFFSSFFTIVAIHGLHVLFGILWMLVILANILTNRLNKNDFLCLGLFWHFLDIIWICIFSFVYLFGIF